jgi:hypothetical protein
VVEAVEDGFQFFREDLKTWSNVKLLQNAGTLSSKQAKLETQKLWEWGGSECGFEIHQYVFKWWMTFPFFYQFVSHKIILRVHNSTNNLPLCLTGFIKYRAVLKKFPDFLWIPKIHYRVQWTLSWARWVESTTSHTDVILSICNLSPL